MTRSILIDPFAKTVTEVMVSSTDDVHQLLGPNAGLAITPLNERAHSVMAKDAYEVPGQRFWRFMDTIPYAGRCLLRGNSADGLAVEDCPLDALLVQQNVEFPDVEFAGWRTVPDFRPLAPAAPIQVLPQPIEPQKPQAEPAGKPWSLWTVTETDDGYVATLITFDASGAAKHTGIKLENEDLDELRALLPPGLSKLERVPTDDPSIIESWHTAPL